MKIRILSLWKIAAAVVLASPLAANAQTVFKASTGTDLSLGTSWDGGFAPDAGDLASWNVGTALTGTFTLGEDVSWRGIAYQTAAPTGGVTINAGNTLTLGTSGLVSQGSGRALTVNSAIILADDQTWTAGNSSPGLTINGNVNTQGFTLTFGGGNAKTFGGTVSGGGSVIIQAAGVSISTTNAFAGVADVTVSDTGTAATLNLQGGNDQQMASLYGNGNGTVRNQFTSGTSTLIINGGGGSFAGTLADGTNGGFLALTKSNVGTQTLTGANTYTGATTITGGTLSVGATGSIDDSALIDIRDAGTFDVSEQSYTMLGSQAFTFTLNGAGGGSAGLLNAAALNIDGADVEFDIVGVLDDPFYVIANYTSFTGTTNEFASVTGLPSGYTVDYGFNGGTQIALVIPEPGVPALFSLGLMALWWRTRSRRRPQA